MAFKIQLNLARDVNETQLTDINSAESVAYCGLVCAACIHSPAGCRHCRNGGGDPDCYQRQCCRESKIDGCWQCDQFPCNHGYFSDPAWKGLCIGFCLAICEIGIEDFARSVSSRFGGAVDYGRFRFKTGAQIKTILESIE
ncbi:DUF3795 domain-containing protein [candidate division KSB1 bacterium]|nr:DUF3795 domain-containing protein [candidate division KSB1 bacterium]